MPYKQISVGSSLVGVKFPKFFIYSLTPSITIYKIIDCLIISLALLHSANCLITDLINSQISFTIPSEKFLLDVSPRSFFNL